jgi:hypothetical protein
MISWRHKLCCSVEKAMAFLESRDDDTIGGTGAVLITEHVFGVAGNRLDEVSDIAISDDICIPVDDLGTGNVTPLTNIYESTLCGLPCHICYNRTRRLCKREAGHLILLGHFCDPCIEAGAVLCC